MGVRSRNPQADGESEKTEGVSALTVHQLPPEEPLSPELVLVLSPEHRAQAIATLGPPVWPAPRPRPPVVPVFEASPPVAASLVKAAEPVAASLARSVGIAFGVRLTQLVVIFVAVTLLVLAMSIVAQAFR